MKTSVLFEAIEGDITKIQVDAVVNAANTSLLGGGGVDGAIHRVAGPKLLEECKRLGGCPTGDAKITQGYNLPAKYVIHAVGPVWRGGKEREDELLGNCYRRCLDLANERNIRSLAFPCISTGVYHFPKDRAAHVAYQSVRDYTQSSSLEKIVFVCFSSEDFLIYQQLLNLRK